MAINALDDKKYSPYRFSVEQYYRMAEVGLLAPDARTELIEGEICDKPPIGCRHSATVAWLHWQLSKAVGDRAWVVEQYPLRLSRHTEPQPDLMVLRSRRGHYSDATRPRAIRFWSSRSATASGSMIGRSKCHCMRLMGCAKLGWWTSE